ncbi:MAG: signal recognition particle-docking protein FtsY [Akkermansiaceae bacterium]|nr:signal recognition particle-docking protein FtsY [Akkermansiaceae bacterium]MDB2430121.1 signal recognition particle-docking protein FtsY [Akkermansiaceae bacterium]MDB4734684.1 signal recognition particle-docking protein FtsY [Akkermansiaceae bacterium]OUV11246.1 MAG: signal recognition particle-docking protein FtsY [Verrucomicrobiaceae bacterium TMED86]
MAGFFKKLINKITNTAEIDWDDLEAELITGDLGVKLSLEIVSELQGLGRKVSADDVVETTRTKLSALFPEDSPALQPRTDGKPAVLLVVGVNGTGKTTSTAKLGHLLQSQGYSVLLAAADTFRAAAVEQLVRWGERLNLPVVTGAHEADPSSVCYQAHQRAINENYDFLLCDTAGRLHTRNNLMDELSKIKRTISKQDETAPHETFIVVDATTGGNALNQAREFQKAVPLDGLVITKLDGSGKGGVAAAIQKELNIPPRFIGTGEEPDQFSRFQREEFVQNIL